MVRRIFCYFGLAVVAVGTLYAAGLIKGGTEVIAALCALSVLFLILFGASGFGKHFDNLSPGFGGQILLWIAALFHRRSATFKITHAWKEILNYQEGGRELTFLCWNMSSPPYELEFPSEETWLNAAPQWAKNQRNEVLERLQQCTDLKIIITDSAKIWGK